MAHPLCSAPTRAQRCCTRARRTACGRRRRATRPRGSRQQNTNSKSWRRPAARPRVAACLLVTPPESRRRQYRPISATCLHPLGRPSALLSRRLRPSGHAAPPLPVAAAPCRETPPGAWRRSGGRLGEPSRHSWRACALLRALGTRTQGRQAFTVRAAASGFTP